MTIPAERTRSVQYARELLRDLLDPKKTPRVPKEIRLRASRVLRHYPGDYDLTCAAAEVPNRWAKPKGETRER